MHDMPLTWVIVGRFGETKLPSILLEQNDGSAECAVMPYGNREQRLLPCDSMRSFAESLITINYHMVGSF